MNLLGTWLTDRMDLQLHVYQLKILIRIVKVKTTASLTTKVWVVVQNCTKLPKYVQEVTVAQYLHQIYL